MCSKVKRTETEGPPCVPLKVSPYAAYLHDAVLLYAQTVRELAAAGQDFRDGRQLVGTLRGSGGAAPQGEWLGPSGFSHLGPAAGGADSEKRACGSRPAH